VPAHRSVIRLSLPSTGNERLPGPPHPTLSGTG
jgi:hypothetical protein